MTQLKTYTKQVRNIAELPSWFNLSKYSNAKNLSIRQWYWQLQARWIIASSFRHDSQSESGPVPQPEIATQERPIYRLLSLMRDSPLIDFEDLRFAEFQEILDPPNPGIGYASLKDIRDKFYFLDDEHRQMAKDYVFGPLTSDAELETSPFEFQHPEFAGHESHIGLLSVNWEMPDNILIENFSALIKANKTQKQKYRVPDIKLWTRVGLLPYLDLEIWQTQQEKSITNNVLAEAILPDGEGDIDVVRKTTAKIAAEIFSISGLNTIFSGVYFQSQ